jgi:branched-chain amino acid transport system substrate-binding protein
MTRAGIAVALALTAAVILAGCGATKGIPGNRIRGNTLTIYASVPLHGTMSADATAVINGARLALGQAGSRIGKYAIVLRPLDDSTAARGGWDPGQTTINAKLASADRTTIGYLGEFTSGASAVSIPILSRFGIPQVSPASTAVGLTSTGPGAAPGEPDKYYPTKLRTFARVVPTDVVQARVQVEIQQQSGCHKTYVVEDEEVDGQDMADSFQPAAQAAGLTIAGVQVFPRGASDYSALAQTVAQSGADCVLISAITDSGAVLVARQIAAALPSAKLFGASGVAQSSFTDPALGGIPLTLDPRLLMTLPPPGDQRLAATKAFYAAYERRSGMALPAAIYGYEAMSLLLSAITRATEHGTDPAERTKVLAALFGTRNRHSVLGTYSIDRLGDTTMRSFGVYRVLDGSLEYWKALDG